MILRRSEQFWSNFGLAAILALALVLRLWGLDHNGFGNQYYSAGVRSMLESWHNFFFNAFDPAGFVSLDKPPVAFWIQAATARVFGFSGFSVLLPQVLEGTAAVGLLYIIVRRTFGVGAGLLSALFLAITPISVAVDRSSNTDTCLVFVLLLAAWALSRAAESGSRRILMLSMALVGIAFNVKMLAAFIVLPAFVLVYLIGAPIALRQKLSHLVLGGVVVTVISLSWSVIYDLTPPEDRPYVGGTTENSMLELVIGHNGLQRFLNRNHRLVTERVNEGTASSAAAPAYGPDNEPAGPLRLFSPRLAGQAAWLLPLAIFGLLSFNRRKYAVEPLDATGRGIILWGGWALTYGMVYSALARLAPYYLVTMGPPFCALAGIGAMRFGRLWNGGTDHSWIPPLALLFAATWEAYIAFGSMAASSSAGSASDWPALLSVAPLAGALLAVLGLIAMRSAKFPEVPASRLAAMSCGIGLAALLVNPAAWSLNSIVAASGNSARPVANPPGMAIAREGSAQRWSAGRSGFADEPKLTAFLKANHTNERYLAVTPSARLAAPIIIHTGAAVMAMGGFSGADPILGQDELAHMVADRQIRFVIVGGAGGFGSADDMAANQALADWVRENGTPVDPALWRDTPDDNTRNQRRRSGQRNPNAPPMQLYDLNPSAGFVSASAD